MRKIGIISVILIAIGFIFYLYHTDQKIKEKVITAEMAIRDNMEKSFQSYNETVRTMVLELDERLQEEKEELDPRLEEHKDVYIRASQEDYLEIKNEIIRLSDAFRAYDERIKQFKRSLPMDKSTKDTEDLYNMILVVFQKHRDYFACYEKNALPREVLDNRIEEAINTLQRRRRLDVPEIDDYDHCRDELTTFQKSRSDLLEFWRELKRRPITF